MNYRSVVVHGAMHEITDDGEKRAALEALVRRARRIPRDDDAIGLVLRRGGDDRIEPYADFSGPRRRAFANSYSMASSVK